MLLLHHGHGLSRIAEVFVNLREKLGGERIETISMMLKLSAIGSKTEVI